MARRTHKVLDVKPEPVLEEPSILMEPEVVDPMAQLQQTLHRIEHKLDFLLAEKKEPHSEEAHSNSICVNHT